MGSSVILPQPGQPVEGPDPNFSSAAVPNLVSFALNKIGPPSPLYIQAGTVLILGINTILAAGDSVTFRARLLMAAPDVSGQPDLPVNNPADIAGGRITQTVRRIEQVVAIGAPGVQLVRVQLAEGYLLSVAAIGSGASTRGLTVAFCWMSQTLTGQLAPQLVLFQDYTANGEVPGWPGGRVLSPLEGPGNITSVQVANPAAGADWILTVPAGVRFRLITMNADLAVANSGAARPIEIIVDDGANVVARMAGNIAAPINGTSHVNFSNAGTPSTAIATDVYAQQPSAIALGGGMRVRSVTTNIVGGDQWSNIWFLVERWVDA